MVPHRPIVVAGAGVGGLTTALALARHGLPVEVYERRTAEEIRNAPGSGLTLWSNASTPLGRLGLGDRLLAAAERVVEIRNFDSRGRIRFTMRTHPYIWPDRPRGGPDRCGRRPLHRAASAARRGARHLPGPHHLPGGVRRH